MAGFVNPLFALPGGVDRGASLTLTIDRARRQRSEREGELSLRAADSKLELARTMKKDKATMMGLIQSAAKDYQKAGINLPEIDPKAFEAKGVDTMLSDALDTWAKNIKSGAWDADFGRKWLISQGAKAGEMGEEVNAITEHAYKEALKVREKWSAGR